MPFPNYHAARLESPSGFDSFRSDVWSTGKGIYAVMGRKGDSWKVQSIRFDSSKWKPTEAQDWIRRHGYRPILFEKATGN
jgi:hypothetical protein